MHLFYTLLNLGVVHNNTYNADVERPAGVVLRVWWPCGVMYLWSLWNPPWGNQEPGSGRGGLSTDLKSRHEMTLNAG